MKFCIVQCKPNKDKSINLTNLDKILNKAKKEACDLVVFPELYLTGYDLKNLKENTETLDGKSVSHIRQVCKKLKISTIFGFPRICKNKIYNSACLIDENGNVVGCYDKTHLFGEENNHFEKGNELNIFDFSFGKIGLLICYDIEFPEPARILAMKGADMVCCISANMKPYDNLHKMFIKSRAVENSIPIIYCNYVGHDDEFTYCGRSNVINNKGVNLKQFSRKNRLLYCEIKDFKKVDDPAMNYLQNLRTDIYKNQQ